MSLGLNTDALTALGAFMAGLGSLMGGFAALYYARKKGREDAKAPDAAGPGDGR